MSAIGLASLGVHCENRAIGMATLGVICGDVIDISLPGLGGGRSKVPVQDINLEQAFREDEEILLLVQSYFKARQ